jgi:hypothetical protein
MTTSIVLLLSILLVTIVLMVTERLRADDGFAVRRRPRVLARLLAVEINDERRRPRVRFRPREENA